MNPTHDPDDLLVVEELLADTEPEDAAELRPVLEDLRALAHSGPVAPSAAVQALLLPERVDAPISLDVYRRSAAGSARRSARRPYGRRRPLAIAVALTAAVGAGTAAAAVADEGFRSSLNESVSTVVGVLTGHGVPTPAAPATPAPTAPARPAAPPSNAPEPGRSASAGPT
ncbi:MAG: hypothetical protein HOQ07_10375, partial [Sinomonas sp.]|nr:hypothetical protein [Sinomonas sp.]